MKKRKTTSKRRVYWAWKGQLESGDGFYTFRKCYKHWDRKQMVRISVTVL